MVEVLDLDKQALLLARLADRMDLRRLDEPDLDTDVEVSYLDFVYDLLLLVMSRRIEPGR
jgi:hypothetical protein